MAPTRRSAGPNGDISSIWLSLLLLCTAPLTSAQALTRPPTARAPPLVRTIDGQSEGSSRAVAHLMQKQKIINGGPSSLNHGSAKPPPPTRPHAQRPPAPLAEVNGRSKAVADGLPASFKEASGKTPPRGSKAFGYQIQGYGQPGAGGSYGGNGVYGAVSGGSSYDFNPLLAGGVRGGPGIKARINSRGFQYASTLIAPILDQQIKRARIPPISQNIPEVNGCIQVYNLYVSRYRCPQRVVLYPAPPNQIVLAVQNVDVGVTGNLAGTINILIPIPISGIIEVNAHQVSITVALVVDRSPTGGIALRVASCQASIGYLDAYIVNGGLIGDIANSQFRGRISNQIRSMLPGQLCARLPDILNQEVNSKLGGIPQTISLTQIITAASGAFGLNDLIGGGGGGQCGCGGAAQVPARPAAPITAPVIAAPVLTAPRVGTAIYAQNAVVPGPAVPPVGVALPPQYQPAPYSAPKAQPPPVPLAVAPHSGDNVGYAANSKKVQRFYASGVTVAQAAKPLPRPAGRPRVARSAPHAIAPTHPLNNATKRARAHGVGVGPAYGVGGAVAGVGSSGNGVQFASDPNVCAGCPSSGQSQLGFLMTIVQSLDLSKLSNIYMTVQLLQSYATNQDYTIELNGEFSPNGAGGTPFGPYPMQFPYPTGSKMAEILVSDFTVNSLFYWLHKSGFLTFRLGPETPKIGELLKTTCSDDSEDTLEDHGVEVDEELAAKRRRRQTRAGDLLHRRHKRQDASLTDLGICFGDILPAIRERYPNQRIVIVIRSKQAPSLVLSQRSGGTATLDLVADAEIYIESTNERVGAITISAAADIVVSTAGGRISGHADITRLQLNDFGGTLGLPQDALDNLASLGKEVIQKAANDALERGIALNIPSGIGGLPISFVQPEFHIIEHGIYLASDFTVDPNGLTSLLGGGGGSGGSCRR